MTRRIETVEWGVETDDLGSMDTFETETEARAALADGGTLVRITTTVERDPSATVHAPASGGGMDDVLLRISDLPKVVRDDRYFPAVRVGDWVFYPDVSVEHALATLAARRHFDTTPPNYHLHDGDPVPPFGWRPNVLIKTPESECDDCTEPIDATTPTTGRTTTP